MSGQGSAADSTATEHCRWFVACSRSDPLFHSLNVLAAERRRLKKRNSVIQQWNLWGPYLSERQWGTVREDYSLYGTDWEYLPHDHARSRASRWREDGIGGISDEEQRLCFSLALWNGRDGVLTTFWSDQCGRQPWRGCERDLLLPRRSEV